MRHSSESRKPLAPSRRKLGISSSSTMLLVRPVLLPPREERLLGLEARRVNGDLEAAALQDLLDRLAGRHLRDLSLGRDRGLVDRAGADELGPEPALDPLLIAGVDHRELARV